MSTGDKNTKVIVPETINPYKVTIDPSKLGRIPSGVIGGDVRNIMPEVEVPQYDKRKIPAGVTLPETTQFGGPQYAQGYFQSGWEQLAFAPFRVATKVVSEVAQMPGYLMGGLGWIANGAKSEDIGMMIDNEWIRVIQSLEEGVKDKVLPVFSDYMDVHGSFTQQLFDPTFWANEGADGVGFFLSMLAPGQALKAAGLGTKIAGAFAKTAKVGTKGARIALTGEKAGQTARWIDGGLSAGINTLYEAGAEAGETYRNVKVKLAQEFPDLTEEEVNIRAGKAASNVMKANWGILLATNLVAEHLIWNQFGKASRGIKDIKGTTGGIDKLSLAASKKKAVKGFISRMPQGIISEGFIEEGFQFAVSEYYQNKVMEGSPDAKSYGEGLGGIITAYADGLATTEMQKSIFLGALLGSTMGGVGGARASKAHNELLFGSKAKDPNFMQRMIGQRKKGEQPGLLNLMNNNISERYSDINDLALLDEKGKPRINSDGSVKIDYSKLMTDWRDKLKKQILIDNLAFQQKHGEKENYNLLKELNDFAYMLPWLRQEGGLEALESHLDDLATLDAQRQAEIKGIEKAASVEEIKTDLLAKANRYKDIINSIEFAHNPSKTKKILQLENSKDQVADDYINGLLFSKFQSYLLQDVSATRIAALETANNKLDESKAGDKTTIDINKKNIEEYKELLEKSNKDWNDLHNSIQIKDGFEAFKEERKIVNEAASAAEKAASSKTTTTGKELHPDIAALWEKLHEIETIRDIRADTENVKGSTIVDTEVLHTAEVEISLLDEETGKQATQKIPTKDEKTGDIFLEEKELVFNGTILEPNEMGVLRVRTPGGDTITIRDNNTASIEGKTYGYSLKVTKTPQEVQKRDSLAVLESTIEGIISKHTAGVASLKSEIASTQNKIKLAEQNLKKAIKKGVTKTKKGRQIFIKLEDGERVYMNALEIQFEIDKLSNQVIPQLEERLALQEEAIESTKVLFDEYVNNGIISINEINTFITSLGVQATNDKKFIIATRDNLATKQVYLGRLKNSFKGLRTMFFQEVDKQLDTDYVSRQQDIRELGLDEAEQEALLDELEKAAYRDVVTLAYTVPGKARNALKPIIAALSKRAEKLEIVIADINSIEEALEEAGNRWKHLRLEFTKGYELKTKVLDAYKSMEVFKNKFRVESKYDPDDAKNITHRFEQIELNLNSEIKLSSSPIDSRTKKLIKKDAHHPFRVKKGMENWLVTSGNTEVNTDISSERWAGYVATMPRADFSNARMKTFTLKQIRELPEDHVLRREIKFWDGEHLVPENKITTEAGMKHAMEDIKIVLMTNPTDNTPRLVDNDGNVNSTKENNKFPIFTSMILPVETVSGYGTPRFDLAKAIEDRSFELQRSKKFSETQANEIATQNITELFNKSMAEYEIWRENSKAKSQILFVSTRNPGVKDIPGDWNDLEDVVYGKLKDALLQIITGNQKVSSISAFGGTSQEGRVGFTYLISQNSVELVKPKTLDETDSVEGIVKLIGWLMTNNNNANFKKVEDFLKEQTYFLHRASTESHFEDYKFRLFFEKAVINKKVDKENIHKVVFGHREMTKNELKTKEGQEALSAFLKIKLHQFDRKALASKSKYIEYYINDKGLLISKPLGITYQEYIGRRGTVLLKTAKSTPLLMGQDPQYHNASINFRLGKRPPAKKTPAPAAPQGGAPTRADSPFVIRDKAAKEGGVMPQEPKQVDPALESEATEGALPLEDRIGMFGAGGGLFEDNKLATPKEEKAAEIAYEAPPAASELTDKDRSNFREAAISRINATKGGIWEWEINEETIEKFTIELVHELQQKRENINIKSSNNINDISPSSDGKINEENC